MEINDFILEVINLLDNDRKESSMSATDKVISLTKEFSNFPTHPVHGDTTKGDLACALTSCAVLAGVSCGINTAIKAMLMVNSSIKGITTEESLNIDHIEETIKNSKATSNTYKTAIADLIDGITQEV